MREGQEQPAEPREAPQHPEVIQPRRPCSPPQVVEKKEPERPKIELPEEPSADNADSLELVFRMPLSGERIRRRFLKSDSIGLLYDFVDDLQNQGKCKFEGDAGFCAGYQIIQTMPRKVFADRAASLDSVGFFPRGAML